jgi:putative endonuclease
MGSLFLSVYAWIHIRRSGREFKSPATLQRLPYWGALFFHTNFFNMFFVYVLYSRSANKFYVGYTSNLESRLLSHNELGTKDWTKRYRPWELVYTESYQTKLSALKREKELKTGVGREFIRKMINKE